MINSLSWTGICAPFHSPPKKSPFVKLNYFGYKYYFDIYLILAFINYAGKAGFSKWTFHELRHAKFYQLPVICHCPVEKKRKKKRKCNYIITCMNQTWSQIHVNGSKSKSHSIRVVQVREFLKVLKSKSKDLNPSISPSPTKPYLALQEEIIYALMVI